MNMVINDLIKKNKTTMYKLSKESGIPQATLSDICSGKTNLEKCSVGTIYKLAKALSVSIDSIVEADLQEKNQEEYRPSFDLFKSSICHKVKDLGDLDFIKITITSNRIDIYFEKGWYPESLYLLSMLDYLSRENDIPLYTKYNDLRHKKLDEPIFPSSILVKAAVMNDDSIKDEAIKNSIPEFIRHNIVECEIRDVA